MKECFERLAMDAQSELNIAFNALKTARNREEVEVANLNTHKVISAYARKLKAFIDECMLRVISDHAKIMKLMNDRYNLDPDKCNVSYNIGRNVVCWDITLYDKERYRYVSKFDEGVDMEKFLDWCRDLLQ